MPGKKKTPRSKRLFEAVEDVVASLPSHEQRASAVAALEALIVYLEELRSQVSKLPTREDMTPVSEAVGRCRDFLDGAVNSPILANTLVSAPPRARPNARLSSSDPEKVAKILGDLENLTVDQVRERLLRDRSISFQDLFGVAKSIGVRVTSKTSRDTLAHQLTTAISNRRGYDHLSGAIVE